MKRYDNVKEINKRNSKLPRLIVRISNTSCYAQIIDDTTGKVLASASSLKLDKSVKEKDFEVGKKIAETAKKANVTKVVFDKGTKKYHGHIKNIAESARKAGLEI